MTLSLMTEAATGKRGNVGKSTCATPEDVLIQAKERRKQLAKQRKTL
ncbi:MAG TPA: hypothetical protein VGR76_07935 [Candidatus Angelobacter sp.]|nr:hypothetical protein [Candidatus Angelobacter sp.]